MARRLKRIPSHIGQTDLSLVDLDHVHNYVKNLNEIPLDYRQYYDDMSAYTSPTLCRGYCKLRHVVFAMMIIILSFYLILVVLNPGCPPYIPKPDLNLKRYKGTWYEVYRPYQARFESGDCVTVSYEEDDFEPDLYFKVINAQEVNGTRAAVTGRGQ